MTDDSGQTSPADKEGSARSPGVTSPASIISPLTAAANGVMALGAATAGAPALPSAAASGDLGEGRAVGAGTNVLVDDPANKLRTVAPTFGEVLRSIGMGVAESQAALDSGVIDTVNELADTNITVVTDVIVQLTDDGLPDPDPAKTTLVTEDLSVLSFFMPTIHEWKRVAVSMDLSVGAFTEFDGMKFKATQSGSSSNSAGLFWGFLGIGETHDYERKLDTMRGHVQESSWSMGEVRVDATLGPRSTHAFPVPAQVKIGPQIVFSQGATKEVAVGPGSVSRSIEALVTVLTRAGAPSPGKGLTVDAGPLGVAYVKGGVFDGATTNSDGQVKVTITRNVANAAAGPIRVPITVILGALSQTFSLSL